MTKETELYAPIKSFLEAQGYEVKAEIGAADVVAVRGDEAPIIVELKIGFSLALFHQGVERQAITDAVYLAVPLGKGRVFLRALKDNMKLCRRLGLGLLTVRLKDGFVEARLDPAPYKPRQSKTKRSRLLREFAHRVGDPNKGGSTRRKLVTAYRQDALKCLALIQRDGPTKASEVGRLTGVQNTGRLLLANHYGWFEKIERGIYGMSPKGQGALEEYESEIKRLDINAESSS